MTAVVVERTVIERAIRTINLACDLIELRSAEDAVHVLNIVLDEIEPLANEKGQADRDVALDAPPHPTVRTAIGEDSRARRHAI